MSELGGMPAWAVIGAKVVCTVDYSKVTADWRGIIRVPAMHEVLTIRDVVFSPTSGRPCLRFVEIVNPIVFYFGERGFRLAHFRPVIFRTHEEDVAIFAPLLGARQPELERT
jgi:hypothetical protein